MFMYPIAPHISHQVIEFMTFKKKLIIKKCLATCSFVDCRPFRYAKHTIMFINCPQIYPPPLLCRIFLAMILITGCTLLCAIMMYDSSVVWCWLCQGLQIIMCHILEYPRRAHARGLQYLFCVCVFSLFWHFAQSGVQTALSATSVRYGHEIEKGIFL